MNEENKKKLAFISGMLLKVIHGLDLTYNEVQSLENIVDELDYDKIEENEFRW